MATIDKRIEALEKVMAPIDWEPVELRLYVEDCSKAGNDKPERLSMVIKSGTPAKPGRSYHREETEEEEAFLSRVEASELAV